MSGWDGGGNVSSCAIVLWAFRFEPEIWSYTGHISTLVQWNVQCTSMSGWDGGGNVSSCAIVLWAFRFEPEIWSYTGHISTLVQWNVQCTSMSGFYGGGGNRKMVRIVRIVRLTIIWALEIWSWKIKLHCFQCAVCSSLHCRVWVGEMMGAGIVHCSYEGFAPRA